MGIFYAYKLRNEFRYFPNELNLSLFVCDKECSRAYISTKDYSHICEYCKEKLKRLYSLNYKLEKKNLFYNNKSLVTKENMYFLDEDKEYIDDITYDDLIAGKVDCIGDITEVYIAVACCTNECGNVQLIVDGSTQVCPKCGGLMFRRSVKKYILK